MTIKATVEECRLAYGALRRINEEVRLPQKPAWRVSRLMGKLKPVVTAFEETQLKLFRDAGGTEEGRGITLKAPERGDDEASDAFEARMQEYRDAIGRLNDELRALNREDNEIDYDPVPLEMFADSDKIPEEKRMRFSANDFMDCGPFLKE